MSIRLVQFSNENMKLQENKLMCTITSPDEVVILEQMMPMKSVQVSKKTRK